MNIQRLRRQKVDPDIFCDLVEGALEWVHDHDGNGDDFIMCFVIRCKDKYQNSAPGFTMALGIRALGIVSLDRFRPVLPKGSIRWNQDGGAEVSEAIIKAMARCSFRRDKPDSRSLRRYFKKFERELA